mmetsp:Transcript_8400/g.13059  ORF Transcript_8400/g.13059 Transcript_8400/m.13059 type:complete len:232 (+) Transcript_8400:211-906(+)
MRLCRILKIRCLHNRTHRTRTLTKPAKDALCQINIITRGTSRSICSLLRFNRNSSRGTRHLTQTTRNTSLLARWISTQCMFTAITRRHWTLFKWIHNRNFRLENRHRRQQHCMPYIIHHVMFTFAGHSIHDSLLVDMRILLRFEGILPYPMLIGHKHRIGFLHQWTTSSLRRMKLEHFSVGHIKVLQIGVRRISIFAHQRRRTRKRIELLLQQLSTWHLRHRCLCSRLRQR